MDKKFIEPQWVKLKGKIENCCKSNYNKKNGAGPHAQDLLVDDLGTDPDLDPDLERDPDPERVPPGTFKRLLRVILCKNRKSYNRNGKH